MQKVLQSKKNLKRKEKQRKEKEGKREPRMRHNWPREEMKSGMSYSNEKLE